MSNIKRNILGTIAGFSLTCKWYCTGFITRDFFMWNLCIIIFYNQFIERYCFIQE